MTTDHEKIVLQKKQNQFLCERPGDWLGGCGDGEEAAAGYLRAPTKHKLRSSWLADEGKSQSLRELDIAPTPKKIIEDRLHASESHVFKNEHQEPIVLQKKKDQILCERPGDWLGGCGETEETTYHHKPKTTKLKSSWQHSDSASTGTNETAEESVEVEVAAPTKKSPPTPKKEDGEKADSTKEIKAMNHTGEDPIVLQKKQNQFLCERPGDWLGGCGEFEAPTSHLRQPKSKLRTSWMAEEGMSQSLSRLSLDGSNHSDEDAMGKSESNVFLGKKERRQTSPMILARLAAINQQNEENHKKNEEFHEGEHHGSLRGQHKKPSPAGRATSEDTGSLAICKEYSNTHTKPMRHKALQTHLEPEH